MTAVVIGHNASAINGGVAIGVGTETQAGFAKVGETRLQVDGQSFDPAYPAVQTFLGVRAPDGTMTEIGVGANGGLYPIANQIAVYQTPDDFPDPATLDVDAFLYATVTGTLVRVVEIDPGVNALIPALMAGTGSNMVVIGHNQGAPLPTSGDNIVIGGGIATGVVQGCVVLGTGGTYPPDPELDPPILAAIAIGSAVAMADEALAIGSAALADGGASTAIGASAGASGVQSVALGATAVASGDASIAIGAGAIAGNAAIAIGNITAAAGKAAMAATELKVQDVAGGGATTHVLYSPDGSAWRIGVTNAGELTVTAIL